MRAVANWLVTYHDKKQGTWTEALVISDSLGLNDEARVLAFLEMQRLKDYSLRDRKITKVQRLGEKSG